MKQDDRDREFAALQESEAGDLPEVVTRYVLIVLSSTLLFLMTELVLMLVWGLGYVLLNELFRRFLLGRQAPVRARDLTIGLGGKILMAGWFSAMVVLLATMQETAFLLLAISGVVGQGLHILITNVQLSRSAIIEVTVVTLAGMFVTTSAALVPDTIYGSLLVLAGGIGVGVYFIVCFRHVMTERRALAERHKAETQDHKMRALGQLTSGIAHDFNNLLTVIGGNIELAQLERDGEAASQYLEEARVASDRGAALVKQLLAFAHKSRLTMEIVGLEPLFERLETVLARVLPARIKVVLARPPRRLAVLADPAMLESALLNLVINARDAIGERQGTIRLSVVARPVVGNVEIRVEDTGPGMDAATLERAVEPFFTTKEVGDGSGMGLSMVQGFAEQSGGELILQNGESGGVRASIQLPMVVEGHNPVIKPEPT